MSATQEISAFEHMVAKAEQSAKSNMHLYKLKLGLYALLGYAVIFGIVIALFSLVGGVIAAAFFSTSLLLILLKKKIFLVIFPTIWILLKSLWVKFESPKGYVMERKKFPRLYLEIDRLRESLKAPKIHEVILTPELNASITQTPRLGVFGWNKNTLTLGLELLLTLSPKQARAVIAHEFGHLSGNHSHFNTWIYRIRLSWYRIMHAFDNEHTVGAKMMAYFFDWYAPRFAAYSFALARANEFEADAIAADLTSVESAGGALIHTHVTGPYIDNNYWGVFFKKADVLPKPEHAPWIGLRDFVRLHQPACDELSNSLQEELRRETVYDDTHPCLQDRLEALSAGTLMPKSVKITAAEVWFGRKFQQVIDDFDSDWMQYNQEKWNDRYKYVTESKKSLAILNERDNSELSDDELWQKSTLSEEFGSVSEALTLYQSYQGRCPDDAAAAFVIGRILYNQNDESFLQPMKKALTRPDLVIDACEYAYYYLKDKSRDEEAEWWREQADAQMKIDYESQCERSTLEPKDALEKAEVSEKNLKHVVEILKANGNVKKAWIVAKKLDHYPESPAYALAIVTKGFFLSYDKITENIAEHIQLDCSLFVVARAGDHKSMAKKIIKAGKQIV